MSEIISGKEALIALANGKEVEIRFKSMSIVGWCSLGTTMIQSVEKILNGGDDFRIKPQAIKINGVEVDARTQIAICETSKTIEIAFVNMDDLNVLYNSLIESNK